MPTDPIAICAVGEAAWHACAYESLGETWNADGGLAWGKRSPHKYLFAGITLTPRPVLPESFRLERPGVLRDSWAAMAPDDLPGWTTETESPWMLREPSACDIGEPSGVTVTRTLDALLFEDTVFRANGGAPATPGELHPADSGEFPELALFLAWKAGHPVGTSLSVTHPSGVFVSAVAVVALERRKGIGRALTAAALLAAPDLPATLTASALGLPTYRRLGFTRLIQPVQWTPPA